MIDSATNGYGTDLNEILTTIEEQNLIDPIILTNYFWDMFIVDALIGNWDRHNGNWGFLYNQENDSISIAPIFDCGSSLYPQIDDSLIKKVLSSKQELETRIYDMPTSAIQINNKRVNYYKLLSSHEYHKCDEALLRIVPKINLDYINDLINSVDYLSDIHKEFLIKIVKRRKEILLDKSYKEIISK